MTATCLLMLQCTLEQAQSAFSQKQLKTGVGKVCTECVEKGNADTSSHFSTEPAMCRNCGRPLQHTNAESERVRCSSCQQQWRLANGDYPKVWCVKHDRCKPVRSNSYGVCRTRPLQNKQQCKCKACGVQFHASAHAIDSAWQGYKHDMGNQT